MFYDVFLRQKSLQFWTNARKVTFVYMAYRRRAHSSNYLGVNITFKLELQYFQWHLNSNFNFKPTIIKLFVCKSWNYKRGRHYQYNIMLNGPGRYHRSAKSRRYIAQSAICFSYLTCNVEMVLVSAIAKKVCIANSRNYFLFFSFFAFYLFPVHYVTTLICSILKKNKTGKDT